MMVRKQLTEGEKQKRKERTRLKARIRHLYLKDELDIGLIRDELRDRFFSTFPKIDTTYIKNYLMSYFSGQNDNLCREITHLEGRCEICGEMSKRLEDAHCIRRGYYKYRWNLNNHCLLCKSHHGHGGGNMNYNRYCAMDGDHQASSGFWSEMKRIDPDKYKWYFDHKDDHETVKFTLDELQEIHRKLKQELAERKN